MGIIENSAGSDNGQQLFAAVSDSMCEWGFDEVRWLLGQIEDIGLEGFDWALNVLSLLNNRRYDCGGMKRSVVLQLIRETINSILDSVPEIASGGKSQMRRIDWNSRGKLRAPEVDERVLVIYANEFPMEGDDCDSRLLVSAYRQGWKRFIVYGLKGQRFTGCGLGSGTNGVRIDVYASSGDYLASGIDGMEIFVHNNAQDQLGQIMKSGKLVVYGDVGQAFMYGAKGGEVYIMGNAAGRPLINAVGRPRVVINGTCLDFLAESFMAGDPHNGGGFVILNGIEFDDRGEIHEQANPYPGVNLFSLASGGAIFVRDPHRKLIDEQLNGGEFVDMTEKDWKLIEPYLKTNEEYFGVSIDDHLLMVDGKKWPAAKVYRKVQPIKVKELANEMVPD